MKNQSQKSVSSLPIAKAELELSGARTACEAILDAYNLLLADYDDAISRGDRAAALKAQAALKEATVDRDMAVSKVTKLERELVESRERAEHDRRVSIYDEAKAARDAAKAGLEEYSQLSAKIVVLLIKADEADRLVSDANHNLPEGYLPLDSSEVAARYTPGHQREVLSEEIVDRWVFESNKLPCDIGNSQYPFVLQSDKRGYLNSPNSNTIPLIKMPFKKVTFRPAKRGTLPRPFFEELRLPSLKGDYLIYPSNSLRQAALGREETADARPLEVESGIEVTFEPLELVSP